MKANRTTQRPKEPVHDQEIPKLDALKQINLNAAGLDIGDDEIYVAVPEGRNEESVRVFGTFTIDLFALANWLEFCGMATPFTPPPSRTGPPVRCVSP